MLIVYTGVYMHEFLYSIYSEVKPIKSWKSYTFPETPNYFPKWL